MKVWKRDKNPIILAIIFGLISVLPFLGNYNNIPELSSSSIWFSGFAAGYTLSCIHIFLTSLKNQTKKVQ